ncbi:MAG: hypothetical protein EPN89_11880 [Methylovulum sp.]|nr:MAG: hypothetical protein EPN89_11880 [Methylovulum sp.]
MNNEQYHELNGKIQGLVDIVLTLVITLEHKQMIDANAFADTLEQLAFMRDLCPELESGRELIDHFVELLDDHAERNAQADSGTSQ